MTQHKSAPMIALLAAIALSVIAVFAREWFDDTIRSPDQFEDKLRLPLLGAVPLVRDGDPRTALREPHSPLSEAYHAIRASIELSSTSGIPHTLLITSSRKGEGKSTTALALAHTARRTDTPMRHVSTPSASDDEENPSPCTVTGVPPSDSTVAGDT